MFFLRSGLISRWYEASDRIDRAILEQHEQISALKMTSYSYKIADDLNKIVAARTNIGDRTSKIEEGMLTDTLSLITIGQYLVTEASDTINEAHQGIGIARGYSDNAGTRTYPPKKQSSCGRKSLICEYIAFSKRFLAAERLEGAQNPRHVRP